MILLAWFGSFRGHGTIGDLLALQAAAHAIAAAGLPACYAAPNDFGLRIPLNRLDLSEVDPCTVDTLVFVCGPILRTHPEQQRLFDRFHHCRKIGLGVSILARDSTEYWCPFDLVFARDGCPEIWSDIAPAAPPPVLNQLQGNERAQKTIIGLCLRGFQSEYGDRACLSERAASLLGDAATAIAKDRGGAVINIENHLYHTSLTPRDVEAQYRQCSLVLTTRLHGALLSFRHRVPTIVVDQIEGGAKITGILADSRWPYVYRIEDVDVSLLIRSACELLDAPPRSMLDSVGINLTISANRALNAFVDHLLSRGHKSTFVLSNRTAQSDNDLAFLMCSEAGAIERHSMLLAESIRTRAGRLRDAPIYAVCPRRDHGVSSATRKFFRNLKVNYIEEPLNEAFPDFPLVANKPIAARFIEQNTNHDVVVTLDTDSVFLNEPTALCLTMDEDVALRPADMRGIATAKYDELYRDYWIAFSKVVRIDIERLPTVITRVDRHEVAAYYQTGLVAARRRCGIFKAWGDLLELSLSQGLTPEIKVEGVQCSVGELSKDEMSVWGADIAALTFAIWGLTNRVRLLAPAYNYPLHLAEQISKDDEFKSSRDLVHVHYHWMFNANHLSRNVLLMDGFEVDSALRKLIMRYVPIDKKHEFQPITSLLSIIGRRLGGVFNFSATRNRCA